MTAETSGGHRPKPFLRLATAGLRRFSNPTPPSIGPRYEPLTAEEPIHQ